MLITDEHHADMPTMKFAARMVPLLLFLSGCASTSLPEASDVELPSEVPFQGATVILVEVDGEPQEIRDRVVQALRGDNYDITQSTLDQPVMETEPRTFGSSTPGSARYHIEIPETAGEPVRIYGRIVQENAEDRNSFMQFQSYGVTPGGQRLSLTWQSWTAMNDLANVIASGDVLYDEQ